MSQTRKGLILTLGGAPASPHFIPGLPGYYRPDTPHLVGGDEDDLTLDEAKAAAKDHADVLELVTVNSTEEKEAEEVMARDKAAGRNALVEARKDGRTGEAPSRAKDEAEAVKGDK